MPLYGGDYLRDTMHLSCAGNGIYLRLLIHYWHTQGPLPSKQAKLEGIAGVRTEAERAELVEVLAEFFRLEDGVYRNKRADLELGHWAEIQRQKSEAGRRGNAVRYGRDAGAIAVRSEGSAVGSPATATATFKATTTAVAVEIPPQSQNPSPVARKRTPRRADGADGERQTCEVWNAYNNAYQARYGVPAVRNAKVNGELAQVIRRLGPEESPPVAAFYVGHNRGLYVSAKHPVNLLVRDCEGLHTEWATGQTVTDTEGRQADRAQSTYNAFAPLIAEAEEREKKARGTK